MYLTSRVIEGLIGKGMNAQLTSNAMRADRRNEDMMTADSSLTKWSLSAGLTAFMLSFSPVAAADTPAPITYSDNTATRSQAFQSRTAAQSQSQPVPVQSYTQSVASDAKTRRVEFRYPDQPYTFYSADGLRQSGAASSPVAFSSSAAAIAPNAAAQISTTATDPAILMGGFDARAAAAKVAQQQAATANKPLRIAALTPQLPTETGVPRTLSRVAPRPDASLSEETGLAGIYAAEFDGHPTANGEIYSQTAMTAAHRSLPLPSLVQVTNPRTNKEIVVRVNDRGPFSGDHILELSPRAGEMLGITKGQPVEISLRYLGEAPVKTVENYASKTIEDDSLAALSPAALPAPRIQQVATQPKFLPRQDSGEIQSGIYIQAGSFSDIANAKRLTERLQPFQAVNIEEARVNGSDYFRVIVGPFSDRSEAEYQRQQLSYDGLAEGFVTAR